jgi:hypothetical protein
MRSAFVGNSRFVCLRLAPGRVVAVAVGVLALQVAPAQAQVKQQGGERAPAVVIRGQVPIPQIVTVRPREVPRYHTENMLMPDRDFSDQIGNSYSLMSSRVVFGASYSTTPNDFAIHVESIGAPPLPPLPPISFDPLPVRYTTVKRQRAWCAPNWWCPSHKVKEPIVAEYPADFPRR